MTTGSSNELMQEGIRHVREGRMAQAYLVFKKVIERDPRNEFAQIWISVTSEDRAEKRAALEKALEINPNNQHAKEALRVLNAEENRAPDPTAQPTVQMKTATAAPASEKPADISENPNTLPPTGQAKTPSQPPRIGSQEFVSNPFGMMPVELAENEGRSTRENADTKPYKLGQLGDADNRTNPPRMGTRETNTAPLPVLQQTSITSKDKKPKGDAVAAEDKAADTTKKRERLFLKRIRMTGLFILGIVVVLLVAFLVYNLLQPKSNNQQQANQTTPDGQNVTTAAETSATSQPAPAITTAAPVATSPAASTTGAATTGAATTATTTTASVTQSAVAKNLQVAKESQDKGDLKGAIAAYQAALQSDANNVTANLALGTLFMTAPDSALPSGTKRYEAAAQAFKLVAAQNPNWAGGYSRLGEALALQGNVKDAITAYSRSLELDPNGPERWLALAALYEKDNQPDQARYCRERAGSIAPATPTTAPTATPAPTNTPAAPSPTR